MESKKVRPRGSISIPARFLHFEFFNQSRHEIREIIPIPYPAKPADFAIQKLGSQNFKDKIIAGWALSILNFFLLPVTLHLIAKGFDRNAPFL